MWELWKDIVSSCSRYRGFLTDYTLYSLEDQVGNISYITILGDRDFYDPDNTEPDYETDNKDDAIEWFNSYEEDATQVSNIGQYRTGSIDLIEDDLLDEGLLFSDEEYFDLDNYKNSNNLSDIIDKVINKDIKFSTTIKLLLFKTIQYLQSLGLNPNFDKVDNTYYIRYSM